MGEILLAMLAGKSHVFVRDNADALWNALYDKTFPRPDGAVQVTEGDA
jgi:hypothetical protein